jgi:hypothetical protein
MHTSVYLPSGSDPVNGTIQLFHNNACQQRSLRVSLATIKRAETGKKSELPRSTGIIRFLCSAGFVFGGAGIS